MPRKTHSWRSPDYSYPDASMRPRPDAAENFLKSHYERDQDHKLQ